MTSIDKESPAKDNINPSYYVLPNGMQSNELFQWLTSNIGQAMQYAWRSSRLDGIYKSDTVEGRIEDLQKALRYIGFEISRLKGEELK